MIALDAAPATRVATAPPAASVVIPTYRRDDTLRRLLDALAAQRTPAGGFEVIVVDDGRSESTCALVEAFAAEHRGLNVRCLAGASNGPATARNLGWRTASGGIIALIDDDAYPADEAWLVNGMAAFDDPGVAAVSGRVIVPLDGRPTDFQRNVQRLEQAQFVTCNAFFRREALIAAGGFDERFTAPYREDSDLQFRVEAAGGRIVRRDDARVVHPAAAGRFAVSLKLQRYSMFNALLYKKHRARFRRDLERRPPLHYYAMVLSGAGAVAMALRGRPRAARALVAAWALLEARFLWRRLRGSSMAPRHVADVALTSALIPPLSIYWRLRGALRYRVLFF